MLPVFGKKAILEWCMKGLIGSSYVCPKCGKSMELRERAGKVKFRLPNKPYIKQTQGRKSGQVLIRRKKFRLEEDQLHKFFRLLSSWVSNIYCQSLQLA
ncbi:hypothetical protein TNCV_2635281 [Trichonephila clavipes]|nr:hypothetical protein TNCV_2635281 [Trichonephila clavipes]